MSVWNHIIVEGYCLFRSLSRKKWKTVPLDGRRKTIIMENKNYIPKIKRPEWCRKRNRKRVPQFRCLCDKNDKRCPFFAMTETSKKEYKMFFKEWNKMISKTPTRG